MNADEGSEPAEEIVPLFILPACNVFEVRQEQQIVVEVGEFRADVHCRVPREGDEPRTGRTTPRRLESTAVDLLKSERGGRASSSVRYCMQ